MTKSETIIAVFEELGYRPIVDEDGDVMIRHQLKRIYAIIGDENEPYVMMLLPQIGEIEDGEEHIALAVCNKLTRELKLVKVYVDNSFRTTSAHCGFYYTDENSLKNNIENSLKIFSVMRTMYRDTKDEILEQ